MWICAHIHYAVSWPSWHLALRYESLMHMLSFFAFFKHGGSVSVWLLWWFLSKCLHKLITVQKTECLLFQFHWNKKQKINKFKLWILDVYDRHDRQAGHIITVISVLYDWVIKQELRADINIIFSFKAHKVPKTVVLKLQLLVLRMQPLEWRA